jgi:hypothetical protein
LLFGYEHICNIDALKWVDAVEKRWLEKDTQMHCRLGGKEGEERGFQSEIQQHPVKGPGRHADYKGLNSTI